MKKILTIILLLALFVLECRAELVSSNSKNNNGNRGMLILDQGGNQTNAYYSSGFEAAGTYEVATRFTPEELVRFYGQKLTDVMFVLKGTSWSNVNVKVYKGSSNDKKAPGTLICTKAASNPYANYFNSVSVSDENITLEYGFDYWLAYELQDAGGQPFGIDGKMAKRGKTCWIKTNGVWYEFNKFGGVVDYSWLIRGMTSGTTAADTQPPVFCSLYGNIANENSEMVLTLTAADRSPMYSVLNAVCNINGIQKPLSLYRTENKNVFKGVIPAETAGSSGTVKIELKDSLNYSAWTEEFPVTWLNKPFYEEGFDHVSMPVLPPGWKAVDGNADQTKWRTGTNPDIAASKPNAVYINYSQSQDNTDDWLFSNGINLKAGVKYYFRFDYSAVRTDLKEYLHAYVTKSQTVPNLMSVAPLWSDCGFEELRYRKALIPFMPTENGIYFFGLHANPLYAKTNTILVDNFSVHSSVTEVDNTPPAFVNFSGSSAPVGQPLSITLKVYDVNGIKSIKGYYKLTGQSDFTSFDIQPLEGRPDLQYRGLINSPGTSTTGVVKFVATDNSSMQNTSTSVEYPISWQSEYSEGFEGDQFPPPYWYTIDFDWDGQTWRQSFNSSFIVHSGTKMAYSKSEPLLPDNGLVTPVYYVKPDGKMKYWCSANNNDYCFEVYTVSIVTKDNFNGSPWMPQSAEEFTVLFKDSITSNGWKEKEIDLNPYAGKYVRLMFRHKNRVKMFMLGLDDVKFLNCEIKPETSNLSDGIKISSPVLKANYPNPFNPETKISYSIPDNGLVKIMVYDCKGSLVETLDNSFKLAGDHSVMFKSRNLSSGIYFYSLEYNGQKVGINRMLLVK